MPPQPFSIAVPSSSLDDLRSRLQRARWPGEIKDSGWLYGANRDYLQELCEYWRDAYDWREQEAALNRMPQFFAEVLGFGVHFVHQRGVGPSPLPFIFTHGWPGSIVEVRRVLGPLTDPAAHGGNPLDAFDVVAPSLPGFGFSEIPTVSGYGTARTAELWDALMRGLGYERYGVQGGDFGAIVSAHLAWKHPEYVVGAHLNMLIGERRPDDGSAAAS